MAWSWKNLFGFGGDESKNKGGGITPQMQDMRSAEQKSVDAFLSNYIGKYGPMYDPSASYGGKLSAGMGEQEGRGQDFLKKYLDQPMVSPNLQSASDYLGKSLKGGFDPGTSDFYAALRDEADYNRTDATDRARRDLGARGQFFSSEALNTEGDINAQTAIGLNKNMAALADQERGRQQQSFAAAPQFEKFMQNIPLERATAAQTTGAYPRELQQADLERQYQEFSRRQESLAGVVGSARGFNTQPMQENYPLYQQSSFDKYLSPILSQVIGQGLPALMSGGASLPFTMGASALSGGVGGGGGGQQGYYNNSVPSLMGAGGSNSFFGNLRF